MKIIFVIQVTIRFFVLNLLGGKIMFKPHDERGGGEGGGFGNVGIIFVSVKRTSQDKPKNLGGKWVLLVSALSGDICEDKPATSGCNDLNTYKVVSREIQESIPKVKSIFEATVSDGQRKALKVGSEEYIKYVLAYLLPRVCTCKFKLEALESST